MLARRCEARMPGSLQQRWRLGEVSYDPTLQTRVYNHVFEITEERDKEVADREREVRAAVDDASNVSLSLTTWSRAGGLELERAADSHASALMVGVAHAQEPVCLLCNRSRRWRRCWSGCARA